MYFFRKYCRQKPNIRWWVMYGLFCPSVINYMISGKIQTDRSPVIWYKYVSIIFCIRVCIIGSNIPNTIILRNITHLYILHISFFSPIWSSSKDQLSKSKSQFNFTWMVETWTRRTKWNYSWILVTILPKNIVVWYVKIFFNWALMLMMALGFFIINK